MRDAIDQAVRAVAQRHHDELEAACWEAIEHNLAVLVVDPYSIHPIVMLDDTLPPCRIYNVLI